MHEAGSNKGLQPTAQKAPDTAPPGAAAEAHAVALAHSQVSQLLLSKSQ